MNAMRLDEGRLARLLSDMKWDKTVGMKPSDAGQALDLARRRKILQRNKFDSYLGGETCWTPRVRPLSRFGSR